MPHVIWPTALLLLTSCWLAGCATPDADGDGFLSIPMGGQDCDDHSADIHPGAPETCNGRDDDCDGTTDQLAVDAPTWHRDLDGDQFGNPEQPVVSCSQPAETSGNADDCDDRDSEAFPGAIWYQDSDRDDYGDPSQAVETCERPRGYVSNADDCDDTDREINPEEFGYLDQDQDDYGLEDQLLNTCETPDLARRAGDCDDNDPRIHPGALEYCNGIDDNCNGVVDTHAHDASPWYPDTDGDGFGAAGSKALYACTQPVDMSATNDDCDDTNPDVWPGAPEYCDGVDTDCDSLLDEFEVDATDAVTLHRDADSDSWGDPATTLRGCYPSTGWVLDRTDCDDGNSRVSPGAIEQCNGIDDDCDGLLDSADDDLPATLTLYRDLDGDGFGDPDDTSVGCVDGSGYAVGLDDCDLLDSTVYPGAPEICGDGQINACEREPHAALTLCISNFVEMGTTSPALEGDTTSGYFGSSLAALGDADGDGLPDFAVGATRSGYPPSGEVFVMSGASIEDSDPGSALATLHHDDSTAGFGSSLAGLGDINLDGAVDILVGGHQTDTLTTNGGGAWLFHGPLNQDRGDSEAELTILGDHDGDCAGTSISGGQDIDGDGLADLLIGAPGYGDHSQGAVALISSDLEGTRLFSEASTILIGETRSETGTSVVTLGDVDGDGLSDILIGVPYDEGTALLFLGGFSGTLSTASADVELHGESSGDNAGTSVAAIGDLDGDGLADYAIGAPFQDELSSDAGAVYLGFGARSGSVELDELDAILRSGDSYSQTGQSIAAVGDLDLDGQDDILIGAPFADDAGWASGGAWLLPGSLRGSVDISLEGRFFCGESTDEAGFALSALGDITGEGFQTALVGARSNDRAGTNSGAVYLIGAFSWY